MSPFIEDERSWRISKSGYSIKTGWAPGRIVASYHTPHERPLDNKRFAQWLEDAEAACNAHNAALAATPPAAAPVITDAMVARARKAYRDLAVLTTNGKVLNQTTCMEAALTAALTESTPSTGTGDVA